MSAAAAPVDDAGGQRARSQSGPTATAPVAILLVDDERDLVDSLAILIRRYVPGAVVHSVTTAGEGLAHVGRQSYSIVVSDYKMPGMDGIDFLAQVARTSPGSQRVLMTAYPDVQIALRGLHEAAISKFLVKPFDPNAVVDALAELLGEPAGR